jgi:hypothetical protein
VQSDAVDDAGTRPAPSGGEWLGADAAAWAAVRVPWWAWPGWSRAVLLLIAAGALASVGSERAEPAIAVVAATLCVLAGPPSATRTGLAGLAALTVVSEGCDLPVVVFAVLGALCVMGAGAVRSRAVRDQRAAVAAVATVRRALPDVVRRWPAPGDAAAGIALLVAGALNATRPHGWWLTVCAVVICGFGLVDHWTGYTRERGAPTPLPVLRALATQDEDDRVWIFAADDTAARRPLFHCAGPPGAFTEAAYGAGAAPAEDADDDGADDDGAEDAAALGARPGPRPVLLVGAPVAGETVWVALTESPAGPELGFRALVRPPRREPGSGVRASTLPNDGVPV